MRAVYIALVVLAFIVAAPALLVGFVAGALVAALVVSYRIGWRAITPAVSPPTTLEEDEDGD